MLIYLVLNYSGCIRLPNGNTLICEGDYGYWEVTKDKEVVWKYKGDTSFGEDTFIRRTDYKALFKGYLRILILINLLTNA